MILRNFDRYAETVDFDPRTGATRPAPPDPRGEAGTFALLDDRRICLYRDGDRLKLATDGQTFDFAHLTVALTAENGRSRLTVAAGEKPVLDCRYQSQASFDPDDLTAFAELEDFDFGLYLTNLSNDKARQLRMFPNA